MSILSSIKKVLLPNKFTRLEQAILKHVCTQLPITIQSAFIKQINTVKKIQRFSQQKEVNLYYAKHGNINLRNTPQIPSTNPEELFAHVDVENTNGSLRINVNIWLVHGHIFSITFSHPPHQIGEHFQIKKVQFLSDSIPSKIDISTKDPKQFNDWLLEWTKRFSLTEVKAPISSNVLNHRRAILNAAIPDDYITLLQQTDGFQINEWKILGIAEIRTIITKDNNYWILAENRLSGLAIREGSQEETLYYLDFEDDEIQPFGNSFQAALEKTMGMGSEYRNNS